MTNIFINPEKLHDREIAHTYLKRKLKLPAYYGRNLDALYDCMSTMDETNVILTCPKDAPLPETAARFVRVMTDAADENRRLTVSFDERAGEKRGGYRLIAMDMDGTALTSDKKVDEVTREAIRRAIRAGKEVVFCTGRPVSEVREFFEDYPGMRYLLCESGALLYDIQKKEALYRESLPRETVEKLRQAASGRDVCPVAFAGGEYYISSDHAHRMADYLMGEFQEFVLEIAVLVDDLFTYMDRNGIAPDKINLYHTSPEQRDESRRILRESGLKAALADSEISSLECTAEGVNKGMGLRRLSGVTGIPTDEMIMVGDMDNDLEGLEAAGLAVAMGNANGNVKAVSDVTVADNNHCGCAEAICRYLLGTY